MENKSSGGGIGFCSALGLLFIGLKLGNVITWPWLYVLAPFWIPTAFFLILLLIWLISLIF